MRVVLDAENRVLMWTEDGHPVPEQGQRLVELTPAQVEAFRATPNECGVTFDGETFAAIPPLPLPVPTTATSGDFVAALCDLGWYAQVEAAAVAAGGKALALWRHAATFERHNPILIAMAQAIGKTDADLDALFRKTREYQ